MLGAQDAAHDFNPDVLLGQGKLQPQQIEHQLIETFLLEGERQLVDGMVDIPALDHPAHRHVAEEAQLVAKIVVERMVAAAHQDVGLDSDFAKLGHRLLGRFGFQLSCRIKIRNESDMHENHILGTRLVRKLTHGLEEGQSLDVPRGATDFGDQDVDAFPTGVDALLDLVGHVRDHLNRLAQIVTPPLLLNDRLVHLTRAETVQLGELSTRKAFIMTKIEIGLRTILKNIDLAVLERAHRARVDVQIRVKLLNTDGQPARLQKRAKRGRGEPFAQRGNHSARYEDVFHL